MESEMIIIRMPPWLVSGIYVRGRSNCGDGGCYGQLSTSNGVRSRGGERHPRYLNDGDEYHWCPGYIADYCIIRCFKQYAARFTAMDCYFSFYKIINFKYCD